MSGKITPEDIAGAFWGLMVALAMLGAVAAILAMAYRVIRWALS